MQIELLKPGTITDEEHSQRFAPSEDGLSDLVSSICQEGLLQPIGVKKHDGHYAVVFGHRRFEACKRAGLHEIPCIILEGDESQLRKKTFTENFFREDLSPVELAVAIATEIKEQRMTIEQVAQGFKRTVDWVRRQVAICQWPEDVLEQVHAGKLSIAAAANLAGISEEFYRKMLVAQAADNGATARTTAAWLQAWQAMLPPEVAMQQGPVAEGQNYTPLIPQTMCIACHSMYPTDELCYVAICIHCSKIIRDAAESEQH